MRLTHLSLTHFRNFARLDFDLPAGTVLVVGGNAQGKTSILEAIYFLATLTSFHAQNDRQLVNLLEGRKELAVARIVAEYKKGERDHRLEVRIIKEQTRNGVDRTRKEVLLDRGKKRAREVIGHFNAVLFLPQMMQVIEGSPQDRRHYLNLALSQVVPHYAENLAEYRKVLTQRNALLKQLGEQGGDREQLSFWDARLVERGAQLIYDRIHAVQELDVIAGRIHHELTRSGEVLRLDYLPAFDPIQKNDDQPVLLDAPIDRSGLKVEKIQEGFLERLALLRREEIARGMTTTGPHRDELRFLSNGIDLGTYGSRGQVRTAMMTMKLAEVAWMKEKTGHWPVLLLDEVLAELDEDRRADLLKRLVHSEQALLTTTDLQLFEPALIENWGIWNLADGVLKDIST
ncbi:MAG: DNA replication/repair protein RecF [Anaerolineales bacterium]|jgi:DNA replication and repair protein RecF